MTTIPAVAVQSFANSAKPDEVTDTGWYCPLCVLDGVRKWIVDEKPASLRLLHGNVSGSDEPVLCAGCHRSLSDGLVQHLDDHPVGLAEIADRLGVQRATVDQWRARHQLPEPGWIVGGRPCWSWHEIVLWAAATGRWRGEVT